MSIEMSILGPDCDNCTASLRFLIVCHIFVALNLDIFQSKAKQFYIATQMQRIRIIITTIIIIFLKIVTEACIASFVK